MDLTGQRFERLVVVRLWDKTPSGSIWEVRCDCGNTRYVRTGKLRSGEHKSCGCLRAERLVAHNQGSRVPVEEGMRRCSKCRAPRPISLFHKSNKTSSGLQTHCKDCYFIYEWVKKYGFTEEMARAWLQRQKTEGCAVCGAEGGLHLDHDHKTGKPRGFLCGNCNRALGLLEDDPARIEKLRTYVTRSSTC
jgi:hypothetical protein